MKWINRLYIFFIGILLSVTVGFGVAVFYPEPVMPQYPQTTYTQVPQYCDQTREAGKSEECLRARQLQLQQEQLDQSSRQQYERDTQVYKNKAAGYTRTAIFFGIALGSFFAIVGLGIIKKSKLIANGLILAGVLTAIFTRILISLASLGATVTGTTMSDTFGYVEFGVLVLLSIAVLIVGFNTLSDTVDQSVSK